MRRNGGDVLVALYSFLDWGRAPVKASFMLLAAVALSACQSEADPLVTVSDARVVALPTSAAAYFTLANSGGRDRLLSVDAAGVGQASIHQTSMNGGIMRMRALPQGIEIPAQGRVLLSPSGRHVMIQGIARPLAPGSDVRLNLRFERQGIVAISAKVGGPR